VKLAFENSETEMKDRTGESYGHDVTTQQLCYKHCSSNSLWMASTSFGHCDLWRKIL